MLKDFSGVMLAAGSGGWGLPSHTPLSVLPAGKLLVGGGSKTWAPNPQPDSGNHQHDMQP